MSFDIRNSLLIQVGLLTKVAWSRDGERALAVDAAGTFYRASADNEHGWKKCQKPDLLELALNGNIEQLEMIQELYAI